ncbi:MAG TPA: glutamate-1-semialdehyde 2,1-aminomutase, partial [Acidimicrobiales bacterium]
MAESTAASNAAWFERARRVIPGGVDSPVRSFASVGGTPYTVASGERAFVVDVEGTRYVDMVQSYGAVLLGHAHPIVTGAITTAAALGTTFGAPTPGEVRLAEAICARVPGCEQVRLVSSGTEAAMSAVRLARGATGRDRVIKFDGCYHGHADALLVKAGSGVATFGIPGSAGVPAQTAQHTLALPYNNLAAVEAAFAAHPAQIACILVEPVVGNAGTIPPAPGYLEGLRRIATEDGALLIFDEVMTGFRLSLGGAQQLYNIAPDLTTLGKILGGGLPCGAFGGRADV